MEIYSVRDLSFSYPAAKEKALKNINLSVNEGEFVMICGLSGCGKSTLLRQLKTSLRPHGEISGTVYFCGKPVDETELLEQAIKIGFVMQSPDHQSVTDKVWHELAFGLENLGLDNKTIRRRTAEMAAFFGIDSWLEKSIDELSGGQKQILNLASVMIMQPSVLILDEPISQLDPIAANEFVSILRHISKELGTTVIICEHTLDYVYSISDRIVVMSDGRIISDSSPEEAAAKLFLSDEPMFSALPVPTRVYTLADHSSGAAPLDIGSGRKWLRSFVRDKELHRRNYAISEHDKTEKPLLEMKNVWFRYNRSSPDVLSGLDLKAYRGEMISVLGGNGAGKTTLLHIAAGIYKPYIGKTVIDQNLKTVLLPQNPQALFVKDSLHDDLYDILSDLQAPVRERERMIKNVSKLCGIDGLLDRHPYDLSGGEQQKAAIAKLLLTKPDILLLDEPVKGLDIKSKTEIGTILKALAANGACIIMVSHDMDFCAEYADRCALFFGGELNGISNPHTFFSENVFYTTAARRMSKDILEEAVTADDILYALGMSISKKNQGGDTELLKKIYAPAQPDEKDKKKDKKPGYIFPFMKAVSFAVFLLSVLHVLNILPLPDGGEHKIITYILMLLSAAGIIISDLADRKKQKNIRIAKIKHSHTHTLLSLSSILITIPITIFIGIYFLKDAKYLFISLLIMLECMLPFFAVFEKRRIRTRELVLIAVMCALCVLSRAAFYMFPQFKPMTALVIISGAALGAESGFLIGSMTMLVSNIIFAQGPWTPWQMFTMGIIGFLSGMIFGRGIAPRSRLSFSVFGFLSAVMIYGGIMDPAAMIMSHIEPTAENIAAYYIAGFPMDLVHGISTAVFLYIGADPIIKKLERVKLKYGLIQ
ncbi:MAG: ATP-binding cassette domain-containing protein [Clostridia bacterium]|nr:ATP-binding cassette domain-containing protein [Clostridia bacterium]